MPIWLLKFIPKSFLAKYWKPILTFIIFVAYSATLSTCVKNNVNDDWELKEAARIELELKQENKALSEAAELKRQQDSATAEREAQLKLDAQEAEQRAADARADADEQRRLNNETTSEFKALQAASGSEPVALEPDGVRDSLHSLQDKVRSRRNP